MRVFKIHFNAHTAFAKQHSSGNHIKIIFMLLPSAFFFVVVVEF